MSAENPIGPAPGSGPGSAEREVRLLLSFTGGTIQTVRMASESLGAEDKLLRASPSRLVGAGVPEGMAGRIVRCRARGDHLRHEENLAARGGSTLVFGEAGFPPALLSIPDAPAALYTRGTLPAAPRPIVAIIGSRRCTPEGERLAARFARDLSRGGVAVVSGLARGIDSAALRGCLEGTSPAFGVLGSGLDTIYPPENGRLFRDVANRGALISEFPLGVGPQKHLFPRRNRLISGLARGVLVVEASRKSGTLITVDHALSQDRVVMAVPGDVSRSSFGGTNRLIRDGANVVLSVDDIFLSLNVHPLKLPEEAPPEKGEGLSWPEQVVLETCRAQALTADAIAIRAGVAVGAVLEALARLETERLVKRYPGARFLAAEERNRRDPIKETRREKKSPRQGPARRS